ncbi:MAG: hypothetical protein NTV84_11325 [Methanoregula sp.]|nr:hypothetical protein [Methanoregula sp.]
MKDQRQMTGEIVIREVRDSDAEQILGTFNFYVNTRFVAYPELPVPDRVFGLLREGTSAFYIFEGDARVSASPPVFP